MARRRIVQAIAAAGVLAALAVWQAIPVTHGQEAGQQPSPEEMQKMMEQWMKLSTPGQNHARLEPLVGQWKATTRFWMGGPDGPASVGAGKSETRWVLGKRFIQQRFEGEFSMPDATGQPQAMKFEGLGLTGYDNARNHYVGSWADSMGTMLLSTTGHADPDGKTIRMYGEMDEPMMNQYGRMVKYVTRIVSDDKHVFEIYDLAVGEDYKVMEITYERVK